MSLGFASLTLALALGPSVAVEVASGGANADAQDVQALRGWLVERLIEEGFTIAPRGQADEVLMLRAEPGEALMLEASGERFEIEAGPAAVMRLEALHRARIVLEHTEPHAPAASPTAVLGFRSATEAPEGAAGVLESALLVEGYVLTPRPRAEDPVLCVVHGQDMLAASVTRGANACPDPTVRLAYAEMTQPGGVEPIVELLAELAHGEVESAVPSVPEPMVADEPGPVPPLLPVENEDTSERKAAEFRMGVDAGLSVRGAADASVRAFARLGRRPGLGGLLQVSLTPSSQDGLRAVDTVLATGPDFRLGRRRFSFHAGAVAGARVHAFYSDTSRGGAVDWYVGLPTRVSFGKPDGARAYLLSEAFLTGDKLEHRRDNAQDWTRTAWGVRLALGFSFGWRIL